MKIRLKKAHNGKIFRIEGEGAVKEVLIHSDIANPNRGKISICFRGMKTSGIVELTQEEANDLYTTLSSKVNLIRDVKIFRKSEKE